MLTLEIFALHCLRDSPDAPEQVMSQFLGVVFWLAR
jgi:hypothetical protein